MNWFKLNIRIFEVYNSCNRNDFNHLMDNVIATVNIRDAFTKKRYLWNWIRPRDFYKMMSFYIVYYLKSRFILGETGNIEGTEVYEIIRIILKTTKNESIRKSFIWSIMKQVPMLTVDTIQYASAEKIKNILTDSTMIFHDTVTQPFIEAFQDVHEQVKMYQSILDTDL